MERGVRVKVQVISRGVNIRTCTVATFPAILLFVSSDSQYPWPMINQEIVLALK